MRRDKLHLPLRLLGLTAALALTLACNVEGPQGPAGPAGPPGSPGSPGSAGGSCSVTDNGDGTKTILCDDGTEVTVADGAQGGSCTVSDNGDGTKTITCADGTTVTVSDGATGDPGTAGVSGIDPTSLTATIDAVAQVGTAPEVGLQVSFSLTDQAGEPYPGLAAGSLRFTLAKLVPGANGNRSQWVSYINRTETPKAGVGNGDGSPEIQATAERASAGLFQNNNDGTYVYTFATDLADVTDPVFVGWEPDLTHRVALQISGGGLPAANATYDWQPSTGNTTGLTTRNIVKTETCNTCHNKLAIHGGGRVEVRYCATCHNPGTTDANSDESLSLDVMVHRIHMGANLPSVQAGGVFAIWGYQDSLHDYSKVKFPISIPVCNKCHDPTDAETPDAGNALSVPTAATCGSCHDDVDFPSGVGHGPSNLPQQDNRLCVSCHPATGTWGGPGSSPTPVEATHQIRRLEAAKRFAYRIENVAYDSGTRGVTVDFSVVDPTNGDAAYDILTHPSFTTAGAARLAVIIGWSSTDYSNEGSGANPAQPISLNPLTIGTGSLPASANGDGSFRVTATLPAAAEGSGVVAIEGYPAAQDFAGTYNVRAAVKSALQYFAITDPMPFPRRQVVDVTGKCNDCHGVLSFHGSNRTDEGQVCVICHNPNATDNRRRPANHLTTPTADGKKEETIDFKHMIHAIHAADKREKPYVAWGNGPTEHVFDPDAVHFPGILNDCETCHTDPTDIQLPLRSTILGTTIDTDPLAATKSAQSPSALADPADDWNISPTSAVCSACHDSDLAKVHMEQNGGGFQLLQADIGSSGLTTEACAVCHGPGKSFDTAVVHGG